MYREHLICRQERDKLFMIKYSRMAALLFVDLMIVNFSYIFALLLRFEFDVNSNQFYQ